MFIAKNNDLIILAKDTREELEQALLFMQYTSIEETDENYVLYEGQYITEQEAQEQEEQKEKERIQALYMTRSDFFDGFIMAFNLGQSELRTIVEQILNSINITDVEIKVALNNFDNALNFYRKHTLFTLLNAVEIPYGKGVDEELVLVFTSDIWDKFFDTKDYHELQKAIKVKPIPVDDDSDSDSDTDIDVDTDTDNDNLEEMENL